VSGGSVLAAYYGFKKRAALADFKQRFLLRNAEESLQTNLNLLSLAKGLQGGINDPTLFPKWLDDNLYEGATFTTLRYQRRPYIWINASDIYDRTPFVFGPALFGALCSVVECETIQVEHEHPYQAIIDTADAKGCDLIVMASHGRHGISAIVLGSETVKVLTHCKIPVLVHR